MAACECKGRLRCEGIEDSGSVLGWRAKSRCLLASATLSSLLPPPAAEYHGWRSCFVGAREMPRSESVIAGLDFEARAARAAVCSSRSAKRFMCPLLKGMACPEVMGVVLLLSTSVLRGGEGGGVIPAQARSALRRDSASWRGFKGGQCSGENRRTTARARSVSTSASNTCLNNCPPRGEKGAPSVYPRGNPTVPLSCALALTFPHALGLAIHWQSLPTSRRARTSP